MPSLHVRGASGLLKKGYQIVARLQGWSMDGSSHVISASRSEIVNAFYLDHDSDFIVALQVGRTEWIWRNARVLSADPMTLTVSGAPDVRR